MLAVALLTSWSRVSSEGCKIHQRDRIFLESTGARNNYNQNIPAFCFIDFVKALRIDFSGCWFTSACRRGLRVNAMENEPLASLMC